ncbi:hypothetical protein ACF1AB_35940 [Streptomyces sp. NPDC014846]|uniref:hypothetical protein n=1 Tax=Streptomyces sp. NPDC014846 TaxID=3364922 RepID=UPI0036F99316
MRADFARRRLSQGLATALIAVSAIVAGPTAGKAEAFGPSICDLPGGKYACKKADEGLKWMYDKSGADTLVDGASEAIDFATDPLGYMANHMRGGAQALFNSFGEELTGKKVKPRPKTTPKISGGN